MQNQCSAFTSLSCSCLLVAGNGKPSNDGLESDEKMKLLIMCEHRRYVSLHLTVVSVYLLPVTYTGVKVNPCSY